MLLIVFVLVSLAIICLSELGRRVLEQRRWRRSLVAIKIRLPQLLLEDQLVSWLTIIRPLVAHRPIGLELRATHDGIDHYLVVPVSLRPQVIVHLRTSLPGVRVEKAPLASLRLRNPSMAAELRMTHREHRLTMDSNTSSLLAILVSLQPLSYGEVIHLQWLISSSSAKATMPKVSKAGVHSPTFRASGRVLVKSSHPKRANLLLSRVIASCKVMNNGQNAIVRHPTPDFLAARRHRRRALPLGSWPLHLSIGELVGLAGIPLTGMHVSGIYRSGARHLPPFRTQTNGGIVLARSNYTDGLTIRLDTQDRLAHLSVIGPTGTGKSALLANLALQDISAGRGVVVVDPKGDLVNDILARIPSSRSADVVVIDPSATKHPIGFNPLQFSYANEHAKELTADYVLHVCKQIWHAYWGPRTDDILRATLLTLLSSSKGSGMYTLCEVPTLLMNPAFRRGIVEQGELPAPLENYWRWFEAHSPSERLRMIGPVVSKIRSLTQRTALQLMLGQADGFDLAKGIAMQRIILVPLAKGKIGSESASLIGSLFIASLWQATLSRIELPQEKRHPFFAYIDEFSEVVRLPIDLADVFVQARGLGLGLTVACQYLDQLTPQIRSAVLGTVRSHIAFGLGHDDARIYEKMFVPSLNADDLSQLAAYEVAIRALVDNELRVTTGVTLPLPAPLRSSSYLANESSRRFGTQRSKIERLMDDRAKLPISLAGEQIRPGPAVQTSLL